MTAAQITSKVVDLIKTYTLSTQPEINRTKSGNTVSFTMHTTSTRSSSVVTRLKLMMAELSTESKEIAVEKRLNQIALPKDRSELAFWRIYVFVPIRERKKP